MKLKNFILSVVILGGLFLVASQTFAISGDYGLTDTVNQTSLPKDIAGQTNLVGMAGVIVKAGLSLVGLFFFGLMLYAGIVWMKSMGASEDVTRAKDIIQAAIIGLIIVTASYAITSFVFSSLGATAGSGNPAPQTGGLTGKEDATKCTAAGGTCGDPAVCANKATPPVNFCNGGSWANNPKVMCCIPAGGLTGKEDDSSCKAAGVAVSKTGSCVDPATCTGPGATIQGGKCNYGSWANNPNIMCCIK